MESAQVAAAHVAGNEFESVLHEQLLDRRDRLQRALSLEPHADFAHLLGEVDAALARFDNGLYGVCEACQSPIESDRLMADPLVRLCLGDLTQRQLDAIQDDLNLASDIQKGLLPKREIDSDHWQIDFVYQPASVVSGDYVDVIPHDGELFFILGDVSGKGLAASLLMSNLHAMFHTMVPLGLSISELMQRANRLFSESTLASHYATLVCGKINSNGEVEVANAGHLPPLLVTTGEKVAIESAGLPLGLFCNTSFAPMGFRLKPNDTLLLYTDGVTEANDPDGTEFGVDRLIASINGSAEGELSELIGKCVSGIDSFRGSAARNDDLTLLAVKYTGEVN